MRALVQKADLLTALGDDRAASSFYQYAIQSAPPPDQLSPELRRDIERAMQMRNRIGQKFEQFLLERL